MTTPTPLPKSTRFFRPGVTKMFYAPDVAEQDAPTRSEVDASTDLSGEVSTIDGFGVTSGQIETPDLVSLFTGKIGGRTSVDDSSITFYASKDSQDVRTILPRGTEGYILIMGGGDVDGGTMDVFQVRVISAPKQYTLEDEAAKIVVQFSIVREPSEDVTIPAAA
ncbi:MAG: hypothetical protein ACRDMV_18080 [Streptosporangiales bacterium]